MNCVCPEDVMDFVKRLSIVLLFHHDVCYNSGDIDEGGHSYAYRNYERNVCESL